jgi:uncharacterized protein
MPTVTPIQLLVVQPTPFCNLDCTYCYLPHRGSKARMQPRTLEAIGRSIVASPLFTDDTTLVWHAGEPCVLPPDWYRDALAIIEKAGGRRVPRQAMQTNATLLDDTWIAFIKEQGISVGVSLDGPEWINDARRVTRGGQGTFARAQEGIARLRAADIPFHLIAVVTAEALAHPVDFAQALAATGAQSIGLNIEEVDGSNRQSSLFDAQPERVYGEFLMRFVDTIEAMDAPPRLREVDRFTEALRQGSRISRHMENSPGAIVSIGHGGQLSTFSPELLGTRSERYDDFVFGDVHMMSDVVRMFLNPAYLKALVDIHSGVAACSRTCRHFAVCGGGSPSNKLGETGRFDSTQTMFCRLSVKATFDALLSRAGVEV